MRCFIDRKVEVIWAVDGSTIACTGRSVVYKSHRKRTLESLEVDNHVEEITVDEARKQIIGWRSMRAVGQVVCGEPDCVR
jgi:hypothetical protein